MTAKTMTDVLAEHRDWAFDFESESVCCIGCDWTQEVPSIVPAANVFRAHQAAVLFAAGFGLVADAKAEALEEAAANIITNDPLDYWNGHLPEGLGFQEAMSRWLKAHAKAKRAAS